PVERIRAIDTYYRGGALHYRGSGEPNEPGDRTAVRATRTGVSGDGKTQTSFDGVAVTIGVGRYAEVAHLAAREVAARTGLETVVLGDREFGESGLELPHYLKFRLFDLVDTENLLFFEIGRASCRERV